MKSLIALIFIVFNASGFMDSIFDTSFQTNTRNKVELIITNGAHCYGCRKDYLISIDNGYLFAQCFDRRGTKELLGGCEWELSSQEILKVDSLINGVKFYNEPIYYRTTGGRACAILVNGDTIYKNDIFGLKGNNENFQPLIDYMIELTGYELKMFNR